MSGTRLDTANLLGACIGLFTWGVYSGIFAVTIWIVRRHCPNQQRSPVMLAALVIYPLSLGATVTTAIRIYQAFITSAKGALGYLQESPDNMKMNTADDAIFFISDLSEPDSNSSTNDLPPAKIIPADMTVAWRLWIIWSRDFRILILPIIALAMSAIGGTVILSYDVLISIQGNLPAYVKPWKHWTASMFTATLVTNWAITGLIIGRLWWADRRVRSLTSSGRYTKVIIAMVESGLLYSVGMASFLILELIGNGNSAAYLSYSLPRIVGIVPAIACLQRELGYVQPCDRGLASLNKTSGIPLAIYTKQTAETSTIRHTSRFPRGVWGSSGEPQGVFVHVVSSTSVSVEPGMRAGFDEQSTFTCMESSSTARTGYQKWGGE